MECRREAPPADGRISFRIRIGVTGHVDLRSNEALTETLFDQIQRIQRMWGTPSTPIRLAVVSQLAKGPDRFIVWDVFRRAWERNEAAQLEVVLPMAQSVYACKQGFGEGSRAEFERMHGMAEWVSEPHEDLEVRDAE